MAQPLVTLASETKDEMAFDGNIAFVRAIDSSLKLKSSRV